MGGNWRYGGFALTAWLIYQTAKSLGHADGYFAGYSDGHTETTKNMLGILGLIRFRGHFPKGGYDVQNGIKEGGPATPAAVH